MNQFIKKIIEATFLFLLFIFTYRFPAYSGYGYIEVIAVILFPILLSIIIFKKRSLGWVYLPILMGWIVLLYWLPNTIATKGHISYPLAILLSFLLYNWETLGLLAVILCSKYFHIKTNSIATACVTAVTMVLLEILDIHVYTWSWGSAIGSIPWLAKSAAFLGTHGLTAIIWLSGFWIGSQLVKNHYQVKYFFIGLLPLIVIFTILPIAWYKLPRGREYHLNVVIIQPNFQPGFYYPNAEYDMWCRSDVKLQEMHWPNKTTTLLLWPESSLFGTRYSQENLNIKLAAKKRNIVLLFGINDDNFNLVRGEAPNQSSFLQAKVNLMPFGERMPGPRIISQWLDKKLGFLSQKAGILTKASSFAVNTPEGLLKIHPVICCEAMISRRVQSGINISGGDIITNHTNDGWFEESAATDLHAAEIRLRAVENGVPLIRATLTGKSGIFREDGSWLLWDKPITENAYSLYINWRPINTPAKYAFTLLFIIISIISICVLSITKFNSKYFNYFK